MHTAMNRPSRPSLRQRGAALAMALILLVVITVLAVAGMRSASMGFVMASNEQLRQRAFNASETGIEQSMSLGTFNPATAAQPFTGAVPGSPDTYAASINTQLNGNAQGAIWGNSWNSFSSFHFEIQSTGTTARSTNAVHVQGVAVIAPYSSTYTGAGGI